MTDLYRNFEGTKRRALFLELEYCTGDNDDERFFLPTHKIFLDLPTAKTIGCESTTTTTTTSKTVNHHDEEERQEEEQDKQ
jgi:hypothetical protein